MKIAYKYLFILLIFQIIDTYTTYCLLDLGYEEANFIVLYMISIFGEIIGLGILKVFAMIILFLSVPQIWNEKWVRIATYITCMVYFIVCTMNLFILSI